MKKVNFIPKRAKRDLTQELKTNDFVQIEGKLEMAAMKNGKVFHYDVGSNVVTIWAKHATMHLLTGEAFSSHGNQRKFDTGTDDHSLTYNPDGTLLSGEQYFAINGASYGLENRWTKSTLIPSDATSPGDSTTNPDEVKYPFFPSKMLFGTGFEWQTWADVVSFGNGYAEKYDEDDNWSAHFNPNVLNDFNDYSDTFVGSTLEKTRTMNDIYSGSLTNNPTDNDFAVRGAIKNGLYFDNATEGVGEIDPKIEEVDNNEFSIQEYRGIGKPSYIYALRNQRFMFEGSEVRLSSDDGVNIENKITFTVNMPEQTGDEAGLFYPYNGFILKQAGLFCDARMLLENTIPTEPDIELDNYNKMPYGIMIAKRNIAPIQKSHDVAISSRWTLYL